MNPSFLKHLAVCLLAVAAACAHAGVGVTQIPGVQGGSAVTVFYPTADEDKPVTRGPFTMMLAERGAPLRGNGRLVMFSHGSGGNAWVHSDLARALVQAGFIVAAPTHRGDTAGDNGTPGPESWKQRPGEISLAIDAVAKDPRFAPLVSFERVGMYGMSAGGHTALSLAGGSWSPALFARHCEANIAQDFPACVGLMTALKDNFLDGLKKTVALGVIRSRFDDATPQAHNEPRIQAVVAAVPFAADFDPASLAKPRVPLGLVIARQDKWLATQFHSGAIRAACASCETVADLPTAGHGAMLSPPVPRSVMSALETDLIGDPPGFDRAALMPEVDRRITAFFTRHLLP
ncbi:MAG: dienelactone hydrolase [Burkholderiales bacterium]|nr:dienelactone hydrolase [Burkholderiales bacterium]